MRIHCLKHAFFEGALEIDSWAAHAGHTLRQTRMFADDSLPSHDSYDLLIVLGGPMGSYDEAQHPWLIQEKVFLRESISQGKIIFGICLGCQLLAEVLGGRVYKGPYDEIGWHLTSLTKEAKASLLDGILPECFQALQWHGDTFELPPGAKHLAISDAYRHQAFQLGDRILGIQFHLDISEADVERFVKYSRYGKRRGPHGQTREEIVAPREQFSSNLLFLWALLGRLAEIDDEPSPQTKSSTSKRKEATLQSLGGSESDGAMG